MDLDILDPVDRHGRTEQINFHGQDESYRTCTGCGRDCELDTSADADGIGVRIAWVCRAHGLNSIIAPFDNLR